MAVDSDAQDRKHTAPSEYSITDILGDQTGMPCDDQPNGFLAVRHLYMHPTVPKCTGSRNQQTSLTSQLHATFLRPYSPVSADERTIG